VVSATQYVSASSCFLSDHATPVGISFIYAINDPSIPTGAVKASLYDVDLFDTDATTIARYHQEEKKVVCYFSAGSYESWRPDASSITKACYAGAKMDGWDEEWLDWHTPSCVTNLQSVMTKRIQLAKSKGCDAVDPDNVDAASNKQWDMTPQDQVNQLIFLSRTAHGNGLGIALKNSGDFSITEQCVRFPGFLLADGAHCGVSLSITNARYTPLSWPHRNPSSTWSVSPPFAGAQWLTCHR
jgi:hypothetical protein